MPVVMAARGNDSNARVGNPTELSLVIQKALQFPLRTHISPMCSPPTYMNQEKFMMS